MLKFLSSIRLAILLIAALAGLSVSATIYDQPEMFHSIPFLVLAGAFFVNLLTCSVKLWPGLWRLWQRSASDLVGQEGRWRNTSLNEADLRLRLREQRFRLDEVEAPQGRYIYAEKGRGPLLAPHVLHIGILVVMIGALLSSFAVKEQVSLRPGQTVIIPPRIAAHTWAKTLSVERFETLYDSQKAVDNWVSDFTLRNGKDKLKGETKVNHPFKAQGLSIYQMAYTTRYQVRMDSDQADYAGTYEFPEGQKIPLPDGSMAFSPMADDLILYTRYDEQGQVRTERALRPGDGMHLWPGTTVYYEKLLPVTVLELKYDRSIPVVFLGFLIASLGCFLFWMGRHQVLAIFIASSGAIRLDVRAKGKRLRESLAEDFALEERGGKERSY